MDNKIASIIQPNTVGEAAIMAWAQYATGSSPDLTDIESSGTGNFHGSISAAEKFSLSIKAINSFETIGDLASNVKNYSSANYLQIDIFKNGDTIAFQVTSYVYSSPFNRFIQVPVYTNSSTFTQATYGVNWYD